jgi:hypothetical protein
VSTVIVGLSQLDQRLDALKNLGGRAEMGKLAMSAVREEKLLVHRKTGFTARTISAVNVTDTGFTTVAHGAAPFLEFGTRPHIIRPKTAKALRWASGGNATLSGRPRSGAPVQFAKVVHHPGTKPYPFMVPGITKALQGLGDLIVRLWNGAA